MRLSQTFLAAFLVVLLLSMRLAPVILMQVFGQTFHMIRFPYLWNFTPLLAGCLFGGAIFRPRWLAYAVPLFAQILGDCVYWAMSGELWQGFGTVQFLNYILIGASVVIGTTLQRHPALPRLLGTGASVAVGHFLVSNFAIWGLTPWYPRTMAGLSECFTQALPFFPTMLISTLVFSYAFFAFLVPEREAAADAQALV